MLRAPAAPGADRAGVRCGRRCTTSRGRWPPTCRRAQRGTPGPRPAPRPRRPPNWAPLLAEARELCRTARASPPGDDAPPGWPTCSTRLYLILETRTRSGSPDASGRRRRAPAGRQRAAAARRCLGPGDGLHPAEREAAPASGRGADLGRGAVRDRAARPAGRRRPARAGRGGRRAAGPGLPARARRASGPAGSPSCGAPGRPARRDRGGAERAVPGHQRAPPARPPRRAARGPRRSSRCAGAASRRSSRSATAATRGSGFSDAKDPERVPDRRDTYPGQQVTVFDNRGICQHSGLCTDRLADRVPHRRRAVRGPQRRPAGRDHPRRAGLPVRRAELRHRQRARPGAQVDWDGTSASPPSR